MGLSKNRKGGGRMRERVSVCGVGVGVLGGVVVVMACSRPDHSFLLTDAGPRGESWETTGGEQGCWVSSPEGCGW